MFRGCSQLTDPGVEKSSQRGMVTAHNQAVYMALQSVQFLAREYCAVEGVSQGICCKE